VWQSRARERPGGAPVADEPSPDGIRTASAAASNAATMELRPQRIGASYKRLDRDRLGRGPPGASSGAGAAAGGAAAGVASAGYAGTFAVTIQVDAGA
jgi:hypothetical protein